MVTLPALTAVAMPLLPTALLTFASAVLFEDQVTAVGDCLGAGIAEDPGGNQGQGCARRMNGPTESPKWIGWSRQIR